MIKHAECCSDVQQRVDIFATAYVIAVRDDDNDDSSYQHIMPRYNVYTTMASPMTNPTLYSVYSTAQCYWACRHYVDFTCASFNFDDYNNRCYIKEGNLRTPSVTESQSSYRQHWEFYDIRELRLRMRQSFLE